MGTISSLRATRRNPVFQKKPGFRPRRLELEVLEDRTLLSATLVKDIVPGGGSPYVEEMTAVNGRLFFAGSDETGDRELWKSDGTAAGTSLVRNIFPGDWNSSSPRELTDVNGTLFFSATDGVYGGELWKSDGTAAGTTMVKDIYPGVNWWFTSLYGLTNVNGTLFFVAYDGVHGYELWKSNGTAAGTKLVKDIHPDVYDSNPAWLVAANGGLFFTADDGVHGRELWKSDGTEAGTQMVADIVEGQYSSTPQYLTVVNDTLFFGAYDLDHGVYGQELWKSDGTAAGTVLVKDINFLADCSLGVGCVPRGSNPADLTAVGNVLLFSANDAIYGRELWKSDGTAAGTVLVKDINPATSHAFYLPDGSFTNLNGTLFFTPDDGIHGEELWKSDGTAAGTVLVKDIDPDLNVPSNPPVDMQITELVNYIDGLPGFVDVLAAYADQLVEGIPTYVNDLTSFINEALVTYSGELVDYVEGLPEYLNELAGYIVALPDNLPGAAFDVLSWAFRSPYRFVNDVAYFGQLFVYCQLYPYYYWYYCNRDLPQLDTNVGTWPPPGPATPPAPSPESVPLPDALALPAIPGTPGLPLVNWVPTSPSAGYAKRPSTPRSLAVADGTLYFSARESSTGFELWKSDGTDAGTVFVQDIFPGYNSSSPSSLTYANGSLFFLAEDDGHGRELWQLPIKTVPVVNPTSGLITTEAGGTARFTVVLPKKPTANVNIPISSSDTTEGRVSTSRLSFTTQNWNVPQSVTVTGVNDTDYDDDVGYLITVGPTESGDVDQNGLFGPAVSLTNINDDVPPGITVTPKSDLRTTETGGTASFTVVLDTRPTSNVTISLSSSDVKEGTVSPASLTFTSSNWAVAQTAVVRGVDDQFDDGDMPYTIITSAASSADSNYSGVDPSDVAVTNQDNDTLAWRYYESPDVPMLIPDESTIRSTLVVPDSGTIHEYMEVGLDIEHTYDADLDVFLIAPDGTRVELFTDVGGNGDNFWYTCLFDEAWYSITDGEAPFDWCYRPEQPLATFIGTQAQGTWTLEITDDFRGDSGRLNWWALYMGLMLTDSDTSPSSASAPVASTGSADAVAVLDGASSESGLISSTRLSDTRTRTFANPAIAGVDQLFATELDDPAFASADPKEDDLDPITSELLGSDVDSGTLATV